MAKTTLPSKQLELPIMVDMNLRHERPVERPSGVTAAMASCQVVPRRHLDEATAVDLSVYDAISSNYVRSSK